MHTEPTIAKAKRPFTTSLKLIVMIYVAISGGKNGGNGDEMLQDVYQYQNKEIEIHDI